MKLSVIIPVFNEKGTVATLIDRVCAVDLPMEIILVDDGSTDGTREVLTSLQHKVDRVILLERNCGKGAAVKAGFAVATGDVIVIQDADLEYDPQDFVGLLEPIVKADADLVLGSRMSGAKPQRAYYFWHYVGNQVITLVTRILYNTTLSDVYTCYKMFRRSCLDGVWFNSDGFEFDAEFLAKLLRKNIVVYEVPIAYYGRSYEQGKKIRWYHTGRVLWSLFKYRIVD